ncbi:MAG: class I SAM-dependent DNA methyltransferase [Chloroflexi bacterium]|nr:class I SAM-dependent DNA methyltransferase [Chloroflexota bacterium]
MTLTPQEFVSKWKRVTSREKQSYQEHFIDVCHLAGHQTPNDYDPTGTRFAFEMGAAKTSGGQGWADVAKLGFFGWEYKAKDADLDKAYEQLLRYRDALQNPPILIVSDINKIVIRTNYTNLPTRTFVLKLDDLLKPESIKLLKTVFNNPERLKPQETVESVTREAAAHFSRLADNLRRYGNEPQESAHFLIRLLFCLFAEDIGLLPENLFPQLLEQTRRNSKDFSEVLRQLFRAMNTGGFFGRDKILHFNGGLFDSDYVLQLDSADMDIIAGIDALDWSAIEPSIFGTLFERGLDPAKRSQLGAHYTSRDDILLIVEPVLMKPLRDEFEALKVEGQRLKAEGKKSARKTISDMLRGFADKIAAVKVLDPACGSGNFLYVALRLLLDLQNEVIAFADEMGVGRFFPSVTPQQVLGIETNEYAHELAQITIYIGYIQWLVNNGYGFPSEPILKPMKNIVRMDAVLAYDENGKPKEPEWMNADVIVGNPPFLGGKRIRSELGDEYVNKLFELYDGRVPREADLVCYWFEKARSMIEQGKVKRAGLLATNSIRGGANRKVLEKIKGTGDIFWAQSDHEWILDGAAVNVSMIGFDNGQEKTRDLDNNHVNAIHSDLTSETNITIASRLIENANISFMADTKGGSFDITNEQAQEILKSTSNPNGKPNSDVIKKWVNGSDIVQNSRNMWIIDFGVDMPIEQASQYEAPFEYVKKHVFPERKNNKRQSYREKWWIHAEPRPEMRRQFIGKKRFIATVSVAKHRIFTWLGTETIPDHALIIFTREDDYFFGILHSRPHEVWALKQGTSLEDRPRYTPTTTFETFPFPWAPGKEPKGDPRVKAIGQAAQELVEQRDRWLNATPTALSGASPKSDEPQSDLGEAGRGAKRTLTNLYNQRPTWLDLAHKRLDEAVFTAYGWQSDLSDEEILERLLKLNLERGRQDGG